MTTSRLLALSAILLASASQLASQAPPPRSPRETVRAALRARAQNDWLQLLVLVHPVALQDFRRQQLEWALMVEQTSKLDVPLNSGPSMLQAVFGVKDRRELEKLPSTEMLRRWLCVASRTPRPDSIYSPPSVAHTVIGEVEESDSVTHVVFRETERGGSYGGDSIPGRDNVRLVTVRRDRGAWKIMLNGGLVFDEDGGYGIGIVDDDDPPSSAGLTRSCS